MASSGIENSTLLCFYYNSPAGCWNGDNCRFLHIRDDQDSPRPLCRFYGAKPGCWYGKHCYFTHSDPVSKPKPDDETGGTKSMDPNNNKVPDVASKVIKDKNKDIYLRDAPKRRNKRKTRKDAGRKNISGDIKSTETTKKSDKIPDKKRVTSDKKDSKQSNEVVKESNEVMKKDQTMNGKKEDNSADPGEEKSDKTAKEDHGSGGEENGDGGASGGSDQRGTKCGECGKIFLPKENDKECYAAIEAHYFEMLGKADRDHVKIFRKHKGFRNGNALCGACGQVFRRVEDLLRHLGSKYMLRRKNEGFHKDYFWEIAHQFIDRDLGLNSDNEDDMVDYLMILVSEHYASALTDDEDDDDDSDVDTGMATYLTHHMKRMSKLSTSEIVAEADERADNFGFTEDECQELLCQGIKPWDYEAYSALNVLCGYDSDFIEYEY